MFGKRAGHVGKRKGKRDKEVEGKSILIKKKDRKETECNGKNRSVFGKRAVHITTSTRQRERKETFFLFFYLFFKWRGGL